MQIRKIFSFEFITQDFYRDKKFSFGFPYFLIGCKATARYNAMHVNMIIQFLVPGMKDLDDPGCCAEPLFISREF